MEPDERTWEDRLRAYLADPPDDEPDAPSEDAPDDAPDEDVGDKERKGGKGKRSGDAPPRVPRFLRRFTNSNLVRSVASWRTPGGLFPLIATIVFFLFAIVPVNADGDTRLMLIWRAMTGGAYLPFSAAHEARIAEVAQAQLDNQAAAQVAAQAGHILQAGVGVVDSVGDFIYGIGYNAAEVGIDVSLWVEQHL